MLLKNAIMYISFRKYIVWGTAILMMLIISTGCRNAGDKQENTSEPVPPLVKSMIIQTQTPEQTHVYSGEVRSRFETRLAFRVPGKIIQRHVDAGTRIKAGDILMQIDPGDIQQAVLAGKAQLTAAQSQFNIARDQLGRFETLYHEDLMSRAELDRYQYANDTAKALLNQASAQYTQALNQLSYCDLKADDPGVVLFIHAEAGQVVAAGQPVMIIASGSQQEIEINIPEGRINDFNQTLPFQVSFWALPGTKARGLAREISPVADRITRTYTARITLTDAPPGIKLGMTASVSQNITPDQESIHIPLSAIYQTGDLPMVWIIQKGKVTLRTVHLGDFGNHEQVQVIEGLLPGEKIVTAGVHKLHQGESIRMGEQFR